MKKNGNEIESKALKRLLISHGFMTSGRVFFEIFMNVFIWKQTQDLTLLIWFNIIYLFMHNVAFHAFAGIVKKGKVHSPRLIGLLGYSITYFTVSLLQESAINYVLWISFIIGIFNGMYWISYQILRFDLTNTKNRGNYSGLESAVKITADIAMPVIAGGIITLNYLGLGYSTIFFIGAILFLISYFIGNVKIPIKTNTEFHLRKTIKKVWNKKEFKKIYFMFLLGSFGRGSSFRRLLLPLLIFTIVSTEFNLGWIISMFSIIAIISSVIMGRIIEYGNFRRFTIFGGVIYLITFALLVLYPNLYTYIFFGCLTQIAVIMIDIPRRIIGENVIHTIKDYKNHRIEHIVIREWFNIGFGRMFSYIIILFVSGIAIAQLKFFLMIIFFAIIAEIVIMNRVKIDFKDN